MKHKIDIFKTLLSTIYIILVYQVCVSLLLLLDLINYDGPGPFLNLPGHVVSMMELPETQTMARRIRVNSDQFCSRNSQSSHLPVQADPTHEGQPNSKNDKLTITQRKLYNENKRNIKTIPHSKILLLCIVEIIKYPCT